MQEAGTTVLTIGRNNFSPRETTITRWQVADTVDLAARRSTSSRADSIFSSTTSYNFFPGFFSGSYTFRSLASFAGGRPNGANEFFQQNFAGPGTTRRRDAARTCASTRSSSRTNGG